MTFLAAPKRSKLWGNYLYLRLFAKYGAKRPSQKKVIRVQSLVSVFFAGEIGPRSLCSFVDLKTHEGAGMKAREWLQ